MLQNNASDEQILDTSERDMTQTLIPAKEFLGSIGEFMFASDTVAGVAG